MSSCVSGVLSSSENRAQLRASENFCVSCVRTFDNMQHMWKSHVTRANRGVSGVLLSSEECAKLPAPKGFFVHVHTYIHAYTHTYIHTYITAIRTRTHTHTRTRACPKKKGTYIDRQQMNPDSCCCRSHTPHTCSSIASAHIDVSQLTSFICSCMCETRFMTSSCAHLYVRYDSRLVHLYGVATICRLLKIVDLFCYRDL